MILHAINRFLAVFFALFVVVLGITIALIPWSIGIRTLLIEWLLESSMILMIFGLGIALIGISYLAYLYLTRGRRYYFVRGDKSPVQVNETVIRDYLQCYWKELFPASDIPYHFELKRKKMVVQASLPYLPKEEQEEIVQRIHSELSDILKRLLGYPNRIDINLSFDRHQ